MEGMMSDPRNSRCFHCSDKAKWVSVNNAIFLCNECTKIHKKLGIFYSFVVPLNMKLWQHDMDLIYLGGNTLLRSFLKDYTFKKWCINDIIKSKAADYYRRLLKSTAENKNFSEVKPNEKEGIKSAKKPGIFQRIINRRKGSDYNVTGFLTSRVSKQLRLPESTPERPHSTSRKKIPKPQTQDFSDKMGTKYSNRLAKKILEIKKNTK